MKIKIDPLKNPEFPQALQFTPYNTHIHYNRQFITEDAIHYSWVEANTVAVV